MVLRRLPDWANHMGQLKVLDDDNIFLPLQERRVADVGGWREYVTPTPADAYVNAYRKAFDAAGPVPHAPSAVDYFRQAPLDKAALLDRYAQHTAHCYHCQAAYAALGTWRRNTYGLLALSLLASRAWAARAEARAWRDAAQLELHGRQRRGEARQRCGRAKAVRGVASLQQHRMHGLGLGPPRVHYARPTAGPKRIEL